MTSPIYPGHEQLYDDPLGTVTELHPPCFVGTSAQRQAYLTSKLSIGKQWLETDTNLLYIWNGSWVLITNELIVTVVYSQTSGTAGGTGTAGAWTKYPVSGYLQNDLNIAAVSSNQWTLPAGSYEVTGGALIFGEVGSARWRLQNVTDTTTTLLSLTANYNNVTGPHFLPLVIPTGVKFTISSAKVFEIDYWIQSTNGGANDLGFPFSSPGVTEYYGYLTFKKVA